mgnify:CR=1 FL=1
MRQIQIRDVRRGEVFRRSIAAQKTYVRGLYVRGDSRAKDRFSCIDFDDVNRELFLRASTLVFVDFSF